MGVKDQALQDYLKDNERYADLINGAIFDGKRIMDPVYVRELQRKDRIPRLTAPTEGTDGDEPWIMYLERERDFLKLHDKPGERFEAAAEAQAGPDYTMPARLFGNDGVEFYNQMSAKSPPKVSGQDADVEAWENQRGSADVAQDSQSGGTGVEQVSQSGSTDVAQDSYELEAVGGQDSAQTKRQPKRPLIPVFHLVLYLGEKRWKSKLRLREMMDIPQNLKEFEDLLPEYHVNLVDIHEQDPERFSTEWKDIFRLMRHSRKKTDLKKYVEEHMEEIRSLSRDTRLLLAVLLDQYKIIDENRVEVQEMCTAWDGAMEMYKDEGKAEGRIEGKAEGVKEEREQINFLGLRMKAENRIDDFFRCLSDMDFRKKMLCEYGRQTSV